MPAEALVTSAKASYTPSPLETVHFSTVISLIWQIFIPQTIVDHKKLFAIEPNLSLQQRKSLVGWLYPQTGPAGNRIEPLRAGEVALDKTQVAIEHGVLVFMGLQ